MNRPEAEKLLGGYAAGILTPEEKRRLFSAAMDHQAVFDALMDEEGLRVLLADPEVRQQLLGLLADSAHKTVPLGRRPAWRRPAVLGMAASFFLVAVTGMVVLRSGMSWNKALAPSSLSVAESPREKDTPLTQEPSAAPKAMDIQEPRAMAKAAVAPSAPERRVVTKSSVGMDMDMNMSQDRLRSENETFAQDKAMPGTDAAASAPPVSARMAASPAPTGSAEAPGSQPMAKKKAENAQRDVGRQGGATSSGIEGKGRTDSGPGVLVEALPEGRTRFTIDPGGPYRCAVLRTPAGSRVLSPLKPVENHEPAVYECLLGPSDAVDVYWLPAPVADPTSLPASAEAPGRWRRIQPR